MRESVAAFHYPRWKASLMADILFKCPHCSKHLVVGDSASGKMRKCVECSQSVQIPWIANIEFQCPSCSCDLSAPSSIRGERFHCPNCERELNVPEPLRTKQPPERASPHLPPIPKDQRRSDIGQQDSRIETLRVAFGNKVDRSRFESDKQYHMRLQQFWRQYEKGDFPAAATNIGAPMSDSQGQGGTASGTRWYRYRVIQPTEWRYLVLCVFLLLGPAYNAWKWFSEHDKKAGESAKVEQQKVEQQKTTVERIGQEGSSLGKQAAFRDAIDPDSSHKCEWTREEAARRGYTKEQSDAFEHGYNGGYSDGCDEAREMDHKPAAPSGELGDASFFGINLGESLESLNARLPAEGRLVEKPLDHPNHGWCQMDGCPAKTPFIYFTKISTYGGSIYSVHFATSASEGNENSRLLVQRLKEKYGQPIEHAKSDLENAGVSLFSLYDDIRYFQMKTLRAQPVTLIVYNDDIDEGSFNAYNRASAHGLPANVAELAARGAAGKDIAHYANLVVTLDGERIRRLTDQAEKEERDGKQRNLELQKEQDREDKKRQLKNDL